jgi:hypothetical protein
MPRGRHALARFAWRFKRAADPIPEGASRAR